MCVCLWQFILYFGHPLNSIYRCIAAHALSLLAAASPCATGFDAVDLQHIPNLGGCGGLLCNPQDAVVGPHKHFVVGDGLRSLMKDIEAAVKETLEEENWCVPETKTSNRKNPVLTLLAARVAF